ncbi:hypothetical protein R4575_16765 [Acinetobacter baumannii]|nr:hypothetical protein [Acinetobacter baumannii]
MTKSIFISNLINSYKAFMIPFTILIVLFFSQHIPFLNVMQSEFAKNYHKDFFNLIGFAAIYLVIHFIIASCRFITTFFKGGALILPRLNQYENVKNLNINLIKKIYIAGEILVALSMHTLGVTLMMKNDFSIYIKVLFTILCFLTLFILFLCDKYFHNLIKNQLSSNEYDEITSVKWEKNNA